MINKEVSEFSYGYAVTNELASRPSTLRAAPYFPSLRLEGAIGGGFDVALQFHAQPIFLQFKLSESLQRRSANEYSLFGSSYYRFKIWSSRQSNQHRLLLELEAKHPCVFYVAPRFHEIEELNRFYLSSNILKQSVFIRPSEIGKILDDEEHCVAFHRDASKGMFFCSDPKPIATIGVESLLQEHANVSVLDYAYLQMILSGMVELLENCGHRYAVAEFRNAIKDRDWLERSLPWTLRFISHSFFGCELLFLVKGTKK